ncbi:MAG: tetratricopeptide repeat protein [Bacteroidales bacterium]|nr:tetratricopeptide repeat protein [Bacteroidales bacterium]
MINQKKYSTARIIIGLVILLLFPIYLVKQYYTLDTTQSSKNTAKYVGKETCIACHEAEYNDWKGSDHDLAMDYANDTTVLGDFNNANLQRGNQLHKCYRKNEGFFVFTDGADGKMQEYEVKYVFGHFPLQQYLVEFEGGRLQTLALTWNSLDSNWYYMADSVYKGVSVSHNNWLHWTNQAQNWNSMCADCHSTNLKKGYDHKTDSYHTTWSEIDVSCEACHGPASKHIEWANLADYARKDFKNYGLPIKTSGIDNHQYVDNCARCHARRTSFGDFDPHSKSIYNYINPALPTEPNWYIDGQIKEEDYVYASFTQSKMYMNDVQCNDCHNVHSGKLLFEDNKLCTQCHKADDYDTPNHTHHKNFGDDGVSLISESGVKFDVGSGTLCINCHMHGSNFMGVDYRRDHSFRIPRPDLSDKLGTPNACNQCHTNETNQWAQSSIEQWFGISRPYHFGLAFDAANKNSKDADDLLKRIIKDELYPHQIRSSAYNYLNIDKLSNDKLILSSLNDMEPSIRVMAVRNMNIDSQESLDKLFTLLNDETKAVRLEAYRRMMNMDTSLISGKQKTSYELAKEEQYQVLLYNADFPTGKYNLGNYFYAQGDFEKAEMYYLEALKQDSELNMIEMNLAHLYSVMGQSLKAEAVLEKFVIKNPSNGDGLYNYGLILSENRKYQLSLEMLLRASVSSSNDGRIDYNIAMLYDFFEDKGNAERYLKSNIDKNSKNLNSYAALLDFYIKNKQRSKAKKLLSDMMILFPNEEDLKKVQQMLYR